MVESTSLSKFSLVSDVVNLLAPLHPGCGKPGDAEEGVAPPRLGDSRHHATESQVLQREPGVQGDFKVHTAAASGAVRLVLLHVVTTC